jgi:hypothetical protein
MNQPSQADAQDLRRRATDLRGVGGRIPAHPVAWLAGPRWMPERRLVLAPGVVAGVPIALGAYSAFGAGAAFLCSVLTAVLVTIVLGMTIAARRGA